MHAFSKFYIELDDIEIVNSCFNLDQERIPNSKVI